MSDVTFRMLNLARKGFNCSQILLQLGLEAQGKENPDLIKAVTGLAGGLGFQGHICGALTGGVCLLSLYAGRGRVEEQENSRLNLMIADLVDWFAEEYTSLNCTDIIGTNPQQGADMIKCGAIVVNTYTKVQDILLEENINLHGEDHE